LAGVAVEFYKIYTSKKKIFAVLVEPLGEAKTVGAKRQHPPMICRKKFQLEYHTKIRFAHQSFRFRFAQASKMTRLELLNITIYT
jgi:hypothetical protein